MTISLVDQKKAIRAEAFKRRKGAHVDRNGTEADLLSAVVTKYHPRVIAGYLPIRTEIDPLGVMTNAAKTSCVAVPMITAADTPLTFVQWQPGVVLVDNGFGTKVPEVVEVCIPDFIVVPLVAFTRNGGRLGYGGGFYDRTLERLRTEYDIKAVGFAYSVQEFENVPLEITDQPLDLIVTEKEIIELKA